MSLDQVTEVTLDTLLSQVALKLQQGCRFVTTTCLDTGDGHDLLYHFDKAYQLSNLRLRVPAGQVVSSISGLCFAALLVENEIKDLFGLSFSGLAIDFQGRLLLTADAPKAPLSKSYGIGVEVVKQAQPGKGTPA